MMGRQTGDQSQLFYLFNLERRIPTCPDLSGYLGSVSAVARSTSPCLGRVLAPRFRAGALVLFIP